MCNGRHLLSASFFRNVFNLHSKHIENVLSIPFVFFKTELQRPIDL